LVPTVALGEIEVPNVIEEHQPVVAKATVPADVFIWKVSGQAQKKAVNGGKAVHIWGPPAQYKLELLTISVDWDKKELDCNEFHDSFIIQAKDPGPEPNPNPNPNPQPQPQPGAFADYVKIGLSKVNPQFLARKNDVAIVYRYVATEARTNPGAWDAAAMVNEVKVRLLTVLPPSAIQGWKPFFPELAKAFKSLKLSPNDLQGHVKAFEQVNEILTNYK